MELKYLNLTDTQEHTLIKKGILSVEAFLRKSPLHYYDFKDTFVLSLTDGKTAEKIASGAPFAITGVCTSINIEQKDHMQMAKLRVKDDLSDNTLFINVMSADALKISLLEQDPNSPVNNETALPKGLKKPLPYEAGYTNAACLRQIVTLNEMENVTAISFSKLKTGGLDRVSKMSLQTLKENVPEGVFKYVSCQFQSDRVLSCLRWIVRGLNPDLAIRKTICDITTLRELLFNKRLIVGGFIRYSEQYKAWSVLNPPVVSADIARFNTMNVQYSQMKGFTPADYASKVDKAIKDISDFEIVPDKMIQNLHLPSLRQSAIMLHHPSSWKDVQSAKKRGIFDDLLYLAIKLKLNMPGVASVKSPVMPHRVVMDNYIASLPYNLTNGQRDAINQISTKMAEGSQASVLVQGDVGTGKTCVAFSLILQAAENGFQSALAVPYTTLANQHYRDMLKVLEGTGYTAALLTSETPIAEKRRIKNGIENGTINVVIGTHSIFSDDVAYQNLGLIIEDEEHKFGMVHRESFVDKGIEGCHKITMSATPIPKSLANTIYGENSEIITITDKPANRLPVKTAITSSDAAAAKEIIKQVKLGHQAYIVCPAIEKNDKSDLAASIEVKEEIYRKLISGVDAKKPNGNNPTMVVLTGKMRAADKNRIMESFSNGEIDILMSTTVIEVGMNVPNATMMVITGADRFGFSTLHQLRGRVGRGDAQSYCVLQTNQPNEKLMFMQQCTDGFEIAEKDLELRGPGSLFGEKQTGDNYFIGLMLSYPNMYKTIKKIADEACKNETGREIVRRYEEIYLAEELR